MSSVKTFILYFLLQKGWEAFQPTPPPPLSSSTLIFLRMWNSARLIFVYLTSLTCLKSNSQMWLLHLDFYERADKKCAGLSHRIKWSQPRAQINEWMSLNVALASKAGPSCRNGFGAEDHLKVPLCQALSLCLLSDWPEAVHSPRNATWKVSKQGGLGKTNLISVQEAKFDMLMLEWWAALSPPL